MGKTMTMTLGQKQRQFTRMIGILIEYAYQQRYDYCCERRRRYLIKSLGKRKGTIGPFVVSNAIRIQ